MVKAVILAGGLGSRLSEETVTKPKPMVEIGGMPILWHIMKIYAQHGVKDFVICLGYRGQYIKRFFMQYAMISSDFQVDMASGETTILRPRTEDWKVSLIDTGAHAMTGARLRKVMPYLQDDPYFALTYGDGVSDIDIAASFAFHESHGRLGTITAVTPPGRFGALEIDDDHGVRDFVEKPSGDQGMINGGFFVLSPKVIEFLPEGDDLVWEQDPLRAITAAGQLAAFRHTGFWHPMDTLRDKHHLEHLWETGKAPWKTWE